MLEVRDRSYKILGSMMSPDKPGASRPKRQVPQSAPREWSFMHTP